MTPPLLLTGLEFAGLLTLVLVAVLVPLVVARRRQRQRWLRLGAEFGLSPAGEDRLAAAFGGLPELTGHPGRRRTRLFCYTTGSGDDRKAWMAVGLAVEGLTQDLFVSLTTENVVMRLFKRVGVEDLEVGDPVFDGRFLVKTNDPARARAVLTGPVRSALLLVDPGVSPLLHEGEARLVRARSLKADRHVRRDLARLGEIARALERAAGEAFED